MSGTSVSVSQARKQFSALIDRTGSDTGPIYVTRRGRRVAAIVNAEDLDRLIDLAEDMDDIRAAQEARDEMARTQSEPIPWEQVKADLGLA